VKILGSIESLIDPNFTKSLVNFFLLKSFP